MIKEVNDKNFYNQIDSIVGLIGKYFGESYYEDVISKGKNIKISFFNEHEKINQYNETVYLGDEPICVKNEEGAHIFLPVSVLQDKYGNSTLVHLLIHAVISERFDEKYSDFREVLIDYISEFVCESLESRGINVTFEETPIYKSNSFYSKFFPIIKKFYIDNKETLISSLVKGDLIDIVSLEEVSNKIKQEMNEFLLKGFKDKKLNASKR